MCVRLLISRITHKGMLSTLVYLTIIALVSNITLNNSSERINSNPGKLIENSAHFRLGNTSHPMATLQIRPVSKTSMISNVPQEASGNIRKQAIVIIAGFRTGSSFVGELFNQHPNAFYFFEPLFYKFWNRTNRVADGEVIKDLLLCNVSSMQNALLKTWERMMKSYERSRSNILLTKLGEIKRCINNGMCFRHRSKKLCEPQLCQANVSTRVACKESCWPVSAKMLEEECSMAKVRVIKVIRLDDVFELKRSWSHQHIDLKILHLTRDPRSSWLSRATVMNRRYANAIASKECKKDLNIYSAAMTNKPDFTWLKDIYTLIRYEDIAESPVKQAHSIYKSLGFQEFEIQECVVDWIERNTKVTDHLIFGTSRNSTAQKYQWRKNIKLDDVNHVQELCHAAMSNFGYTRIRNRTHLTDFAIQMTQGLR